MFCDDNSKQNSISFTRFYSNDGGLYKIYAERWRCSTHPQILIENSYLTEIWLSFRENENSKLLSWICRTNVLSVIFPFSYRYSERYKFPNSVESVSVETTIRHQNAYHTLKDLWAKATEHTA